MRCNLNWVEKLQIVQARLEQLPEPTISQMRLLTRVKALNEHLDHHQNTIDELRQSFEMITTIHQMRYDSYMTERDPAVIDNDYAYVQMQLHRFNGSD